MQHASSTNISRLVSMIRLHYVSMHANCAARLVLLVCLSHSSAAAHLPRSLVVATGQLRSDRSLGDTVAKMEAMLSDAAAAGAQLLVLPECALVGYSADCGSKAPAWMLAEAEEVLCAACRRHGIAAVVGTPHTSETDGVTRNSAVIIDERGAVIGRQAKMQLVPTDQGWVAAAWPTRGMATTRRHGLLRGRLPPRAATHTAPLKRRRIKDSLSGALCRLAAASSRSIPNSRTTAFDRRRRPARRSTSSASAACRRPSLSVTTSGTRSCAACPSSPARAAC